MCGAGAGNWGALYALLVAHVPIRRATGRRLPQGCPRSCPEVSLRARKHSCLQLLRTQLPASYWPQRCSTHAACLCAPRYAELDIWGLAAGLAASWAALAASEKDETGRVLAFEFLINATNTLQKVSNLPARFGMILHLRTNQRQPAQHRLLNGRLQAAQVVGGWCVSTGTEAWERAAAPWPAELAQYHTSSAKVLLWLSNEEPEIVARYPPTEGATPANRDSVFGPCSRVRTPAWRSCSPRTQRPAGTHVGAPQHLICTAQLYEWKCVAGKAPHAAYLEACCGAAESALLLRVLERSLANSRTAEMAPLTYGAPCSAPAQGGVGVRVTARACIRVNRAGRRRRLEP